ncbi:unnamed protein product [Rangifer tarandus platyrhynchus]|uniref:Uncharacterized protein n=1 Tax=Rangifer tarandus platyrhynchus TaxID=3082113 RepID=A0AC59YDL7_RANTA
MDCSPAGSLSLGFSQARILEWVAMSSSRRSSQHRDETHHSRVSCIAGRFFTRATCEVKVAQSQLTLCDPMDHTVHGIFQARILERVPFSFFKRYSQTRDRTQVSCIAGRFFPS